MRRRIGEWLRRLADRIDWVGAPRWSGMTFTFEAEQGVVVHKGVLLASKGISQPGCPLWYLGEDEYQKAYTEAANPGLWVNWQTGEVMGARK